jgi:hypothetical protein
LVLQVKPHEPELQVADPLVGALQSATVQHAPLAMQLEPHGL